MNLMSSGIEPCTATAVCVVRTHILPHLAFPSAASKTDSTYEHVVSLCCCLWGHETTWCPHHDKTTESLFWDTVWIESVDIVKNIL